MYVHLDQVAVACVGSVRIRRVLCGREVQPGRALEASTKLWPTPEVPTIPQSVGNALSPGPQSVCRSIQISLSGNYWRTCFSLTIPSRRFEAFYKMSQPVPFAIGLMGWGPIQRLWQMGCPWGLPFPPQLPL